MPTDPEILGFGNRWYLSSLENAISVALQSDVEIKMITAPYFLGTKMEAFLTRGGGDYYCSHDLEDMIAVIDGRPELIDETEKQCGELKAYLATEFDKLLADESFIDAIPAHLPPDQAGQDRLGTILNRLHHIINLNLNSGQ